MKRVDGKERSACSGCSLCGQICPKQAISMVADEEGFVYPRIDEGSCIDCGLCDKICPFKEAEPNDEQEIFAARSRNADYLLRSASGGVFSHLSDYVLEKGGLVCGAAYDADFNVVHCLADSKEGRNAQRDSKYVQSNISHVFTAVADAVGQGKHVLFSGTPCQCAAIGSYLAQKKIDRDSVTIVDVVCHGVGSPTIWKQYLNYVRRKYHTGNLRSVVIRNKQKGAGYQMTITGDEGEYYRPNVQDAYMSLFGGRRMLRQSCYACPMKSWNRCSDITIGDFQKAKTFFPDMADGKGVSVVLANTQRGREILQHVAPLLDLRKASRESAQQLSLYQKTMSAAKRDEFLSYCRTHSFDDALRRFTQEGWKNALRGKMKRSVKKILGK